MILARSAKVASSSAARSSRALGLTVKIIKYNNIIEVHPDQSDRVLRPIHKSSVDVENRVEKGGDDVSADKIESRYYNTLINLISAIEESDNCYLFDNSGQEFRLIAKINDQGMLLEVEPDKLPNWFLEHVLKYYLEE